MSASDQESEEEQHVLQCRSKGLRKGGAVRLGQHDFFYLTSFGPGDRLFMLLLMMMAERGNKLKARPGDGSTSYATDVMHIYSLLTDQSGCRWPDGADVSTN